MADLIKSWYFVMVLVFTVISGLATIMVDIRFLLLTALLIPTYLFGLGVGLFIRWRLDKRGRR